MHFSGFIKSSACVHEIMEHADDVSKQCDFTGYISMEFNLLAMF